MSNYNQKKIIDKAVDLASVVATHLSEEPPCSHSIKEIAKEAFEFESSDEK